MRMAATSKSIRLVDDVEQEFAAGNEESLRRAYDAHSSLIYNYCRRANPAQAADLTQEIFLAAWRAHDRFDPARAPLAAWLMGIAKNKVIDSYRRQGRRPQVVDSFDSATSRAPADVRSSAELDRMADRMLLAEAISGLPERAQMLVRMAFFEDLTHQEISERSGLPLGTVKSDIRRGLARLRRHMERADD